MSHNAASLAVMQEKQTRDDASRTTRELFETTCSECGCTCKVPFQPIATIVLFTAVIALVKQKINVLHCLKKNN